jgi:aspartate 1-decarboxylase
LEKKVDPQVCLLRSKIHRATVTDANLSYVGSITIDLDLIEAAGLFPFEQVHVADLNNGERFVTYVMEGERGSGTVCLNGAAARLVMPGDIIIIFGYANVSITEAEQFRPRIVLVDERNRITDVL